MPMTSVSKLIASWSEQETQGRENHPFKIMFKISLYISAAILIDGVIRSQWLLGDGGLLSER
jgi:hypothetical protein